MFESYKFDIVTETLLSNGKQSNYVNMVTLFSTVTWIMANEVVWWRYLQNGICWKLEIWYDSNH